MIRNWVAAIATLLVLAVVLVLWWPRHPGEPAPQPPRTLPEAPTVPALARLARGVNLSNWLQHGRPTEARTYAPDAADFKHIRALGLAHVRLLVNPAALLNNHGLPDTKAYNTLRAAIEDAVANDLLVVLALQLPPDAKAGIAASELDRLALAGTWRWLATALRDLPDTHLAFEPLNEPEIKDAGESRALMTQLAAEVRRAAPRHTIVVAGHGYSGADELAAMQPLHDPNVVYSFHFYEPHYFTHQGANWGDPAWRALRNVPFPLSLGNERWDAARLGQVLERAAAWGTQHKVPVWCSEFGAIKNAPAGDRAAWLREVRGGLEARGIAWTHWDYAGPFGIVSGQRGRRVDDEQAIKALGLARE